MSIKSDDNGLPRRTGRSSLIHGRRVSRPPGEGRLGGVRRIPRSLGGGFLGVLVVVLFFAGLSPDPAMFIVHIALLIAVMVAAVWSLAQTPLRATFDQRWRPHRKIPALDTATWATVADDLGAELAIKRLPRITGKIRGVPFKMEFRRLGGARTIAGAVQKRRVARKLVVYPRRAEFKGRHDRLTGDAEFDRDFRVATADPRLVDRFLHPEARRWIAAIEPERVIIRGRTVTAWCPAYVTDPDRLRGLVELVAAMATSPLPDHRAS